MNMDDNPEVTRQIQVETSMTDIYKEKSTCFYNISILYYTFHYFSATGRASRMYSLNCSLEHSAATPCANTSNRASGQKDFTKLSAWLTHVMGASVRKLRTFYSAPRSRF
jgi:hypothetical protein